MDPKVRILDIWISKSSIRLTYMYSRQGEGLNGILRFTFDLPIIDMHQIGVCKSSLTTTTLVAR